MTIFTKIINKEIPAGIIYEDDLCLAFRDIDPKAPTHILIIPKKEIPTMDDVKEGDKNLLGHLMIKASEIARSEGLKGYRMVINTHAEGGQTVFHLHIHLMGGRELLWPPG